MASKKPIKKPKAPTKPRKPRKPGEEVEEYFYIKYDSHFSFNMSLSEIMSSCPEGAKLEDVRVAIERKYELDESFTTVKIYHSKMVPNPKLEKQMELYKSKLQTYNEEMEIYKEKMQKYKKRFEKYQDQELLREKEKLEKELKRIEKELEEDE